MGTTLIEWLRNGGDWLFWVNRLIDAVFMADMILLVVEKNGFSIFSSFFSGPKRSIFFRFLKKNEKKTALGSAPRKKREKNGRPWIPLKTIKKRLKNEKKNGVLVFGGW